MLNVAITHDVDRIRKTYQYFTHTAKGILKHNFPYVLNQLESIFKKETYWNFPEIIEIEKSFNIKSTFFFLNESSKFKLFEPSKWDITLGRYNIKEEKVIDMIRWLDNNEWEIGVHGSYNSYCNFNLLKKEKEELEYIVGHEIIGIRQHYLNLSPRTWELQYTAGFKYESSWGLNDDFGFKGEKILPFTPLNNHFLVIPLIIMDEPFVKARNRWDKFLKIIELIEKNNGLLVINWHTNTFHENEFPGFKEAFNKIIEFCKTRDARFYTMKEYYEKFNFS